MSTLKASTQQAGRHYKRTFTWIRRPVSSAETEVHHLHEVEQAGESGATPYIAILGLAIFFGSILVVLLAIVLAVYFFA